MSPGISPKSMIFYVVDSIMSAEFMHSRTQKIYRPLHAYFFLLMSYSVQQNSEQMPLLNVNMCFHRISNSVELSLAPWS